MKTSIYIRWRYLFLVWKISILKYPKADEPIRLINSIQICIIFLNVTLIPILSDTSYKIVNIIKLQLVNIYYVCQNKYLITYLKKIKPN